MTMFANREGESEYIKVGITYGPVTVNVTEHAQSARAFHGQLGRLLDDMEGKDPEQRVD